MSEEEFFNKYVMESPFSFKNGIIAHCRELDKADVYEWVANDELKIRELIQENKKLKEQLEQRDNIINKVREIVENKFLETWLESFMSLETENYLKLKEILNIDKGE